MIFYCFSAMCSFNAFLPHCLRKQNQKKMLYFLFKKKSCVTERIEKSHSYGLGVLPSTFGKIPLEVLDGHVGKPRKESVQVS